LIAGSPNYGFHSFLNLRSDRSPSKGPFTLTNTLIAPFFSVYSSIVANRLFSDSASVGCAKMASRRTV
jgi:hypothetical protein